MIAVYFFKKLLQMIPDPADNFIVCGGDSMRAIEFLDLLKKSKFNELVNERILDRLINHTFCTVLDEIELNGKFSEKRFLENIEDDPVPVKKPLLADQAVFSICKTNKLVGLNDTRSLSAFPVALDLKWKFDTQKCIDATVLFVKSDTYEDGLLFIGSHSGYFYCINARFGTSVWTFNAGERIESSACLSKCGNFIVFG